MHITKQSRKKCKNPANLKSNKDRLKSKNSSPIIETTKEIDPKMKYLETTLKGGAISMAL